MAEDRNSFVGCTQDSAVGGGTGRLTSEQATQLAKINDNAALIPALL